MEVSNQHVKYNRPCLEACLRRLRYVIEDLEEARLQVKQKKLHFGLVIFVKCYQPIVMYLN